MIVRITGKERATSTHSLVLQEGVAAGNSGHENATKPVISGLFEFFELEWHQLVMSFFACNNSARAACNFGITSLLVRSEFLCHIFSPVAGFRLPFTSEGY